jgi:glucose-1-phosphate adenylyltransferase
MVLAGGRGRRLEPLTRDRAKAALVFGGQYRMIDLALSNLVNGGYRKIVVLTQYKSQSLNRHLAKTWRMASPLGEYVAATPPQMRRGDQFFQGSADALYQNFNLIRDAHPDHVVVVSADQVHRMDPRQMVNAHVDSGAGVTVTATRVPVGEADAFGVLQPGRNGRIAAFQEKPDAPMSLSDDPAHAFASMGSYVFSTATLFDAVDADAHDTGSNRTIGGDVLAGLVASGDANLYDFSTNDVPGSTERDRDYWRDISTLDAFHSAHMDLVDVDPIFDLYNGEWPIYSWNEPAPPAKFVFDHDGRRGVSYDSMVSQGVIVAGRARQVLQHRRGVGAPARGHDPTPRGGPPGDHRQARRHPGGGAHRRGLGTGPWAVQGQRRWHRGHRQGRQGRPVTGLAAVARRR